MVVHLAGARTDLLLAPYLLQHLDDEARDDIGGIVRDVQVESQPSAPTADSSCNRTAACSCLPTARLALACRSRQMTDLEVGFLR